MFRFASPWLLTLIPLALAAAWLFDRRRRRGDPRVILPDTGLRLRLGSSPWQRLERTLPWLRGGGLALLLVALARPQAGSRIETVSTLGVDIVVALDVSGSMRAEDFRPHNRLEVAKQTVERFIERRPADRLGLVVFAGLAVTRCPLTLDHEMLGELLREVDFAPREQDGTALGMGLAAAVNRLRKSDAKSRVVVLVTDGRNNQGQIGPQAAAEAARSFGIKVYTVGVGTEGEAPIPIGGGRYVNQPLDLDEPLLREIASSTGGVFLRATDAQGLEQGFAKIDELEKTEIESRVRVLYRELFAYALLPALGLVGLERLLGATRLRRLP